MGGMAIQCSGCNADLELGDALDHLDGGKFCKDCFFAKAGKVRTLTKEQLDMLRREVEGETAGLLPQETLLEMIEAGYDRLVTGKGVFDHEVTQLSVEIQRLAGLAVSRKVLEFIEVLGKVTEEQREEVMRVIRKLGKL